MNNYGDSHEFGSLKVDGLVVKYSGDFSSLTLETISKHSKCLPNGRYDRIADGRQKTEIDRGVTSAGANVNEKICSIKKDYAGVGTFKDESLKKQGTFPMNYNQGWGFKTSKQINVKGKQVLVGQLCDSVACDPQNIVEKKSFALAEEWDCK